MRLNVNTKNKKNMKNYIWGIEVAGKFVMSATTRASARWWIRAWKKISLLRGEKPKAAKIVKYHREMF